jgi:hypothetical protein
MYADGQPLTPDASVSVDDLILSMIENVNCTNISNISSPNNSSVGGESFNSFATFQFQNEPDFPFDSGIVLASNDASDLEGVLTSGSTAWTGDSDLDALMQSNSVNATVVEFDFVPYRNQISIDYLFASNEYPNFVCNFTDTFAFIVSGSGIPVVNPYDNDANPNTPYLNLDLGGKNIATIPGTNIPVSPSNIHINNNCAEGSIGEFSNQQYYDIQASGNTSLGYSGQTTPLNAQLNVTPGQTYHIKLVVGDRYDTTFDSAVFIDADSFKMGTIPENLPYNPSYSNDLPDCWTTSDAANYNTTSNCNDDSNDNYIQLDGGNYSVSTAGLNAESSAALSINFDLLNGCNDPAEAGKNLDIEYFDGSQWQMLDSIDSADIPVANSTNSDNWISKNYLLSDDLSMNFKLKFSRNSGQNNQDDISIANLSFSESSSCPLPTNLISDNISAQSVDVSWTSVDNYIGSYNYLILLADDDPLNDPAVTSGSISNDINNLSINQLQANTPYDFYLQSTCDNSLSDPLKFTTNTISTDQFTADNLKVYPNPVNAELNLSLSNNQNIEKISIFDISGKLVKVDKFSAQNQVQINLEQLNSGVYMAKIYADNHTSSESLKNNHL